MSEHEYPIPEMVEQPARQSEPAQPATPEAQAPQAAQPTQEQTQPQSQQQTAPRQPDYKAYHVQNTPDGKGLWNPVGAAWNHKDGKGMQLQLNTMPVDGRVTLREMRQERMNDYAQQRQNQPQQNAQQQTQQPTPTQGYEQ